VLGAIAGDVIGSVHEFIGTRTKAFPLFVPESTFTDDTVLTVAVADALLTDGDYGAALRRWGRRYPDASYGFRFFAWLQMPEPKPYGSFGNGSAMRVSPVAWAFDTEEEVLREAERSAAPTHDHPEGIKGAQATALAILLARQGAARVEIAREIARRFGYDVTRTVETIRRGYRFDETCQGSVPEAIAAFLEGADFEDCVRNAVSLGGDADTLACIAGSVAEPFFGGVPGAIAAATLERLDEQLRRVVAAFRSRYVE
jgi:ADP-ribosylglycohydrolase